MDDVRYRILWIDDETHLQTGALKILEFMGFSVLLCKSVVEGVRAFNREPFDAIVLDRYVKRGDLLWNVDVSVSDDDTDTGEALLLNLRGHSHLCDVPVVFYTQYEDESFQERITKNDCRVRVFSKNMFADELGEELVLIINTYPQRHRDPVGSITDHFSVAPYYVNRLDSGARVLVSFQPDLIRVNEVNTIGLQLRTVFAPLVGKWADSVEGVVRWEAGSFKEIMGVYFNASMSGAGWRSRVVMESADIARSSSIIRAYSGVGRAMVARFLRQCMRETNYVEESIVWDFGRLWRLREEAPPGLDEFFSFLEHLGFKGNRKKLVATIDYEQAAQLIRVVSTP